MYLLDWEPLLIQTVPGVQLGVTVDGAKYLLEVVEDEDEGVVVFVVEVVFEVEDV